MNGGGDEEDGDMKMMTMADTSRMRMTTLLMSQLTVVMGFHVVDEDGDGEDDNKMGPEWAVMKMAAKA